MEPAYHVTITVNDRVIGQFRKPIPDPFGRTRVEVTRLDLVRAVLRGRLVVEVSVGADARTMDRVLALDSIFQEIHDSHVLAAEEAG